MSHEVVNRVEQIAAQLAATAEETENLGRLSVQSVKLIRQAGVMGMLQPTDFGGYAAHPRDFAVLNGRWNFSSGTDHRLSLHGVDRRGHRGTAAPARGDLMSMQI